MRGVELQGSFWRRNPQVNGVSTARKCRRQKPFRENHRLLRRNFAHIYAWQSTPHEILPVGSVDRDVNRARFRDRNTTVVANRQTDFHVAILVGIEEKRSVVQGDAWPGSLFTAA